MHCGLRLADTTAWLRARREDLLCGQVSFGPLQGRPAYVQFEGLRAAAAASTGDPRAAAAALRIEPLDSVSPSDATQCSAVHAALARAHTVLDQWVDSALACTSMAEESQLTASGHDLGSDVLFPQVRTGSESGLGSMYTNGYPLQRIGFSGTPNELLPQSLLPVSFAAAEEAHMLRVLTSPTHTAVRTAPKGWTVPGILAWVAQGAAGTPGGDSGGGAGRCHALIDVGALVTGLSNVEVAAALLSLGLPHCHGCAFIGAGDEKLVLLRPAAGPGARGASAGRLAEDRQLQQVSSLAELRALPAFVALTARPLRIVPLDQCGVPLASLAAFFDQVGPALLGGPEGHPVLAAAHPRDHGGWCCSCSATQRARTLPSPPMPLGS